MMRVAVALLTGACALAASAGAFAFDEVDLTKFQTLNQCPDCDLREAVLAESDLRRARLSGANLGKADLRMVDFADAELMDVDFRKADLTAANLAGADLSRARLRDALMAGAVLTFAELGEAELRGATLTAADLTRTRMRDANGFGLVDIVNSADFQIYADQDAPFGRRKIYYGGDIIFSDYLRREGYVYMSVQWARMVMEELGSAYGIIENGIDAYEIIKDAARFLRRPDRIEGDLPFRQNAVDRVIGFGLSQTASLTLEFVRSGHNREENGALVFDGVLAGFHVGCMVIDNDDAVRPGFYLIPSYYEIGYPLSSRDCEIYLCFQCDTSGSK